MKATRTRLATVIDQRSSSTGDVKRLSLEIAAYLLSEGRTGELDSIMRDIMQLRADHGVVEVIAVDAFPLNDQSRQSIEALMWRYFPDAKQIIISEMHDQSVLGGTKLILANQQLDTSIRSKLNRFKQLTAVTGGK